MEWWEELTRETANPLSTIESSFDSAKVVTDLKDIESNIKPNKPKTILTDVQKHVINIDRRLVTHGNVSEIFSHTKAEETTSQTRVSSSYQKILDKTLDALRLYRKLLS